MSEVEIRFEREGVEGIVAVGTYLIDAAKRFGIRFDDACLPDEGIHYCSVVVASGSGLLSPDTSAESEYFKTGARSRHERLACQARINAAGEIKVMTKEKAKAKEPAAAPETGEDKNEEYRKAFTELPLESKIANLVRLETIALGETVSFIVNSPFKIFDKAMDVMAEFGFKKEEQQKSAVRPEEHRSEAAANGKKKKSAKAKS